ncbi:MULTISPECIES: hypothetical protein [Pseudomonas]|uniref:hypothetical protein n=1 Tax=Pseudomonas TaxID=286 RepID=UPI000876DC33|nr:MULTISPECIES: hypothetical protein [Pseudomonas]TFA84551.1 hypothetical protein F638_2162 [Pseudomonas sp. LAIL14HWK12:I2]SCZ29798.1 hypothetical protein SAMN03159313_2828 [Pseudomonas sp. NFIX46]SDB26782.1 hypothetical protein SAMN03097715_02026 [Pseudomonas putida]SFQ93178.1 hypothetical protein SAMN03159312_5414 [Pseudomonas sp. NFIX49]
MNNPLKALLFVATISVLSACSGSGGLTTTSCFSSDCQSPEARNVNTLKFGGSNIGNSFNQYSSGLMHDD